MYVMIKEWGGEKHLFWGKNANIVEMIDVVVMNVFLPGWENSILPAYKLFVIKTSVW